MSLLKKLASDTAAYGLSSILARLINFLFGFLIINYISTAEYGIYGQFYAYAGFILIVLTHGMETTYFRFFNKYEDNKKVFATTFFSISSVSVLYVLISIVFAPKIASIAEQPEHKEFVYYFTCMMFFDVMTALPFASLRAKGKSAQFALFKIINILIYIALNILFFIILPKTTIGKSLNDMFFDNKVAYIFLANVLASFLTFLMLMKELKQLKYGIDFNMYKKMLPYALPIMLVGFAGMINEMLDRALMIKLLPFDHQTNNEQLGIYTFNYKFAMLMTLFLQAYRYAAEPFFFAQAKNKDSKRIYAETMRIFVIGGCFIFLAITLNIPIIQTIFVAYSANAKVLFQGVHIIPILLLANLFLGIYFNISTWYKVTDKTYFGAIISVIGALVTIVLNVIWVPTYGYTGAAWATLICYMVMVIIGYLLELKYYPISYDLRRISFYILTSGAIYGLIWYIDRQFSPSIVLHTLYALMGMASFLLCVFLSEKKLRKTVDKA